MPDELMRGSIARTRSLTEREVLDAAESLIAAFRATDADAYFGSFSADATFVFHTETRRLDSRVEYEDLWSGWLREGWRVTECMSSNALVQVLGTAAVFTHDVRTTTSTGGVPETTHERETIIFRLSDDGGIIAFHEHLSPAPLQHPDTTEESAS